MVRGLVSRGKFSYRRWRGTWFQPYGVSLFSGIWAAHAKWTSRTIMVQDNDVDKALRTLHRLMEMEGTMGIIRRTRYYEKPTQQRRRYAFEASKAIYNEDMDRKIRFLLRKNRIDQYPGQMIT